MRFGRILAIVALLTVGLGTGADAQIDAFPDPSTSPALPAPETPLDRLPAARAAAAQLRVIQQGTHRMVGGAEVAVYTMDGKFVQRGNTNRYGEPVYPEAATPLDPNYGRLRVRAWHPGGAGSQAGETIIRYDADTRMWRPETIYRFEPVTQDSFEGEWHTRSAIDPATDSLRPRDPAEEWPPRVRVMIDVYPVPVRRYIYSPPCPMGCDLPCCL
jgi:hypothetical protein